MNTKRHWLMLALTASLVGSACKSTNGAAADRQVEPAPAARPRDAGPRPKGDPQPRLPVGELTLESGSRPPLKLTVEVATLDKERQTGMMFREHLPENEGMLFAFPTERYNNFWMHNTLIPLDMYFIDSEWNVVGVVENAAPLTDDPRGVDKMSRYVLEVNAGFAARTGFGAGSTVKFVPPKMVEMP